MKSFRDYLNLIDGVETLTEDHGKFPEEALGPMTGMKRYDGLDNSSPYAMWRFLVAAAGEPKDNNDGITIPDMDGDGPIGQKMSTLSYTKADEEILRATAAKMGETGTEISSQASTEPSFVNKSSPVRGFKGYPR